MFCSNCGKKLEDGMKHCPYCGAKAQAAPENETERKPDNRTGKSKVPLLAAAAVVLITVIVLVVKVFMGGMTLSPVDYIQLKVDGLNTEGKASVVFDTEKLLADIETKKTLTEREREVIGVLTADAAKDFSLSKSSGLSNGDEVEVESSLDKKLLKDFGVTLENGSIKFTVEDLVEIQKIALEDYVIFEYSGFDGNGYGYAYLDWENLRAKAEEQIRAVDSSAAAETFISEKLTDYLGSVAVEPYSAEGLSNGDVMEAAVSAGQDEISEYGVRFAGGTVSGTVEGLAPTETVSLTDYLKCEFSGFDGAGQAEVTLDTEKLGADLQELFREGQRGAYQGLTEDMDLAEQASRAAGEIKSGWRDYFSTDISETEGLGNGDTITLNCTALEKPVYLSYIGCYLEGGSLEITVEGLIPTETIFLTEYLKYEFSGFDGAGQAEVMFDTEKLTADLQAVFEEEKRGAYGNLTEAMNPADEASYAVVDIRNEWRDCFTTELSAAEGLSNGDTITLSCTASEEPAYISYIGCYLEGGSLKITVEGLEEPQEVDLAEALTVEFSGICPNVYVDREVDYGLPYIYDTSLPDLGHDEKIIAKNGDIYEGEITYDEMELLQQGYRVINNKYSYTISGLNSYQLSCTSLDDEMLQPMAEEMLANARKRIAEEYEGIVENSGESSGWIVWDQVQTVLKKGKFVCLETENNTKNRLYLIFRGALPIRQSDRSVIQKDVYYVAVCYYAEETPERTLVYEDWDETLYMDETSAEEAIASEIQNMGENVSCRDLTWEEMTEPEVSLEALEEITVSADGEAQLQPGEIQGNAANLAAAVLTYEGHTYARYDTGLTWKLAEQFCEAAGGHLATVTSKKENAVVRRLLEDAPFGVYWLGASDESWEGGWQWVTGEEFSWTNWYSGQPDNNSGNEEEQENYLETGSSYSYCWNDRYGSYTEGGFILELEPVNEAEQTQTSVDLADLIPASTYNAGVKEHVQDHFGKKDHFYSVYLDASEDGSIVYDLNGEWTKFSATLSTWPDAGSGAAFDIVIWGDGEILFSRYNYQKTDADVDFCLDVTGVQKLSVVSCNRGEYSNGLLFLHEGKLYRDEAAEKQDRKVQTALSEVQNIDCTEWEYWTDAGAVIDHSGEIHRDWNRFDVVKQGGGLWNLNGEYTSFAGNWSVDPAACDEASSIGVEILADGESLFKADKLDVYQGKVPFCVDLTGKNTLEIRTWCNSEDWYRYVYLSDTLLEKTEEETETQEPLKPEFPAVPEMIEQQASAVMTCGNYRYYRFEQAMTWKQAAAFCQAAGGALACPVNEEKNRALQNLISNGHWDQYWMGAQRSGNSWQWIGGEPFAGYANWSDGQPDNYEDSEYLMSMYQRGTWNDLSDEDKTGFVMELAAVGGQIPEEMVRLSELEWQDSRSSEICDTVDSEGWLHMGSIEMNASNDAYFTVSLNGGYTTFEGTISPYINASDNVSMWVEVFGDGKCLYSLDDLRKNSEKTAFLVDVSGVKTLSVMTHNAGSYDNGYLYLTDVTLEPAESSEQVTAARLADLVDVDTVAVSKEYEIFKDAYGLFHDRYLYMEAGKGASVMYNLEEAYTEFTGTVTAAQQHTDLGVDVRITILADQEELQVIDFEKVSGPVTFTVDLTGKKVLEVKAETLEEEQSTVVYLTDDRLF